MARSKRKEGNERMTTEYLLDREVERVLACLTWQNRLIIRTVLHTGLRISDVLGLRTEQLKPSGWLVEKKTGKRRRYGIPEPLLSNIKRQAGKVWAFPSPVKRGNLERHKTRQAVWHDVKRAQRAFRLVQNVGTHSFRKVYAVQLMSKYGDIEKVRRNLNHSSATVTVIYACADVLLERRLREKRKKKLDKSAAGA